MKFNPYLMFTGNCEEALRFYAALLGGQVVAMMKHADTPAAEHTPPEWQQKIIHGRIAVGEMVMMGSDAPPGRQERPQGFMVCVNPETVEEAERVYAALAEGATVTMPLQETFWAQRFGMLVDRFGTPWMVNCEKPAA